MSGNLCGCHQRVEQWICSCFPQEAHSGGDNHSAHVPCLPHRNNNGRGRRGVCQHVPATGIHLLTLLNCHATSSICLKCQLLMQPLKEADCSFVLSPVVALWPFLIGLSKCCRNRLCLLITHSLYALPCTQMHTLRRGTYTQPVSRSLKP